MKLEIYSEICCDYCNDVIHNHFDCPVCKEFNVGTSIYHSMYDMEIGEILECNDCHAQFKLIKKDTWVDDWEWELIKEQA
jgi:hypothetical protein